MLSPKWKRNVPLSASNAYGAFETGRLREPGTGFAKKEMNVICSCLRSTKFAFSFPQLVRQN